MSGVRCSGEATASRRVGLPSLPDIIEGLCLAAFAAAIVYALASGAYTTLATPRSKPYLIVAAGVLAAFAIAACCGVFHATPSRARRWLAALVIPALLISVPFRPTANASGFDPYAGGRAIAIDHNAYGDVGAARLHGLDAPNRTITIRDDEFGAWAKQIDHHPDRYVGYHVSVTGFVERPSVFKANEIQVSRQFMSCCILDMTPFGFVASSDQVKKLKQRQWVSVEGKLVQRAYGVSGHDRQGLVLQVDSIRSPRQVPTGYFYLQ